MNTHSEARREFNKHIVHVERGFFFSRYGPTELLYYAGPVGRGTKYTRALAYGLFLFEIFQVHPYGEPPLATPWGRATEVAMVRILTWIAFTHIVIGA